MPKNIVICADGTGNAGGSNNPSNVWRLYQALAHKREDGNQQIAIHDDGVGTQSLKFIRILGMGVGLGLSENLAQLYAYLSRHFEEGDRIFLFGFSRGAFTVRTFANMLYFCGISKNREVDDKSDSDRPRHLSPRELDNLASEAVDAYRRRNWQDPDSGKPGEFRRKHGRIHKAAVENGTENSDDYKQHDKGRFPIEFVGVWDTVDAVGLPTDEMTQYCLKKAAKGKRGLYTRLFGTVFRRTNRVHDPKSPDGAWEDDAGHVLRSSSLQQSDLTSNPDGEVQPFIRNAYHAISIDDERRTFHPTMYLEDGRAATEANANIVQVWFAGAHANVGGGYPKDGLAFVSLRWMLHHAAEKSGLALKSDVARTYREASDPHGPLYDPRALTGLFYRYRPRDLEQISKAAGLTTTKIHPSMLERVDRHSGGYAPTGLPVGFTVDDGKDDPRYSELPDTKVIKWNADQPINWNDDEVKQRLPDRNKMHERTANVIWWRERLYIAFIIWVLCWVALGAVAKFTADAKVAEEKGPVAEFFEERVDLTLLHDGLIPWEGPWWIPFGFFAVLAIFFEICRLKTVYEKGVNSIRQLRAVSRWQGARNTALVAVVLLIFNSQVVALLKTGSPAVALPLLELLAASSLLTVFLFVGFNVLRHLSKGFQHVINTTEFSAWETLIHEDPPELPKIRNSAFLRWFHGIAGRARKSSG